ncbi:hypothetical protein [Phaeovulum vinaykumarii]|uniref:Uncharacterized protein n=1 Tax=Phaeovulum vinaykumarii TaxID=407234 RepID=A0A1N7KQZ5_9RHOB|nr:hypothetical protein [Phaeovulum vinaykumarii]SIS63971.1 hypothetical protein SAMN05421795_10264 [Phaeovulum vinaykumarii]SOC01715.1 hypothetical protein SAMN05878426_102710 [Phaeovulum vinaykumarii]
MDKQLKLRVVTIGASVLMAAASGYLMQSQPGAAPAPGMAATGPVPSAPLPADAGAPAPALAAVENDAPAPGAAAPEAPVAQSTPAPMAVVTEMAERAPELPAAPQIAPAPQIASAPQTASVAEVVSLPETKPAPQMQPAPQILAAPETQATVASVAPALVLPAGAPAPDTGTTGLLSARFDGMGAPCGAARLSLRALPSDAPQTAGMADLVLSAPCEPNARIRLTHAGISFTVATDAEGRYAARVPVFETEARYEAVLPDGSGLSARTRVEGLSDLLRVALASSPGSSELGLNVREQGAEYGAPGHVHAGHLQGQQGWMIRLGDASLPSAQVLEVYTAPVQTPDLALAIEAPVSAGTCGRDMRARSLRKIGAAEAEVTPVSIAMPECDGADGAVLMPLPDLPFSVASAG